MPWSHPMVSSLNKFFPTILRCIAQSSNVQLEVWDVPLSNTCLSACFRFRKHKKKQFVLCCPSQNHRFLALLCHIGCHEWIRPKTSKEWNWSNSPRHPLDISQFFECLILEGNARWLDFGRLRSRCSLCSGWCAGFILSSWGYH